MSLYPDIELPYSELMELEADSPIVSITTPKIYDFLVWLLLRNG